jgi:Fur family ferric uptake transcriptional regulator
MPAHIALALPRSWRRRTGARALVLEVLRRHQGRGHLSVEAVHREVVRRQPAVALATVYRALDDLRRGGQAGAVDPGDGRARFELARPGKQGHHHHLICDVCRRITDYNDFEREEIRLVRKTGRRLARKHGYRIRDHRIEFLGTCPRCAARQQQPIT